MELALTEKLRKAPENLSDARFRRLKKRFTMSNMPHNQPNFAGAPEIWPTQPERNAHAPRSQQTLDHRLIPEQPEDLRFLTARDVASRLCVSERWVRDHTTRRSPRIRAVKLGSLIRYRWRDVEAFLEQVETMSPSRGAHFSV
jgi:hypothetical protein